MGYNSPSSVRPAMSGAKCSIFWTSGRFRPTRWSRSPRGGAMGVEVSYGDRTLKVKALEHFDFSTSISA